jgi:hypothetical protein
MSVAAALVLVCGVAIWASERATGEGAGTELIFARPADASLGGGLV